MLLETTINKNKELVDCAFDLHKKGILPDSYIIDMDMLIKNAKAMLDKAKSVNVNLYFMLKQLGRNPYIAKKLLEVGFKGAVVVDYKEAAVMMENGIPIGNVGHLVQTPTAMLSKLINYGVEEMTVYSLQKIKDINEAAASLGKVQAIMLRVYSDGDMLYPSQSAGFHLDELPELAEEIKKLKNVKVSAVTAFPTMLFDEKKMDILPTHNKGTVCKAKEILEDCGFTIEQVNLPSATCCLSLDKIASYGGTHGEPGHGLTGSTPAHAHRDDLVEKPCVVYMTEISHNFDSKSYAYGGGYYRRSHVSEALVGRSYAHAKKVKVNEMDATNIDYHFELDSEQTIGDCVVMAFRFQIFVTRSNVVLVEGIHSGQARVVGIYNSLGDKYE